MFAHGYKYIDLGCPGQIVNSKPNLEINFCICDAEIEIQLDYFPRYQFFSLFFLNVILLGVVTGSVFLLFQFRTYTKLDQNILITHRYMCLNYIYRNQSAFCRHILFIPQLILNNAQTTLPFLHTFLGGSPTSNFLALLSRIMTVRSLGVE